MWTNRSSMSTSRQRTAAGSHSRQCRVQDWAPYHPPDPPLRPAHSGIDSILKPIVFWTAAADPDGDSVRIKFCFGDSQPAVYGRWVRSRVAVSDTVVYQTPGWKVVHAVASDGRDTSAMSAPDSIFINSPPSPHNPRP